MKVDRLAMMPIQLLLICICVCVFGIWMPISAMGQSTNDTKLRIAIPVREFTEFVRITKDPTTGDSIYGGFAVEVFRAVVNTALTTPIPFEFIPFAKPDGTMNGTFDDMLKAVASKQYDGAVGEISILYTRTQWVDFTMPYLDTSIAMLVRVKEKAARDSKGISLGTITKYVVASSLIFSFVFALVFWILEYKNDKRSRNSHHDDWQKEMMGSMIQTRLVMILFFMVLLVLIACYSSQTSSLATQRTTGGIKNINHLIRAGSRVGYREGSFIRDMLLQRGLSESNLISLGSDKEVVDMLWKGGAQGGVDALIADTPTLKLLEAKHCDKFTTVPTFNFHSQGFGFAFQIGYERLGEVSKGILRLMDNGQLAKIQDRTIGSLQGCQDDPNATDGLLDSDSLWILIAGAVAVFILMIIIMMLYCGFRCRTRRNGVVAYPCYLSPFC